MSLSDGERAAIRAHAMKIVADWPPPSAEQLAMLRRVIGPALREAMRHDGPTED
jgi:hypothetical protein